MTDEERTGVRRMINQTIERLQKASVGANHMGSRYSRLIQLLWRKSPKAANHGDASQRQSIDTRLRGPENGDTGTSSNLTSAYDPNAQFNMGMNNMARPNAANGTFSWLDLDATWNFATQNNSVSGGSAGEMDDMMGVDTGMSPFDMTDYRLLDGDNPNFIF